MRPASTIFLTCAIFAINGCSSQPANQPAATAPPSAPNTPLPSASGTNMNAPTGTSSSADVKPTVDACTVLTSDEIKAVQGEGVKETTPSNRSAGDFIVSQCYYALPTASNSISVTLTEHNPESKRGQRVKDFWENTFGKDEKKSESERKKEREEREKKKETGAQRESEEEEGAPLEPVRGVGEEAFWSASRVGGALYVLKNDRYIRISVGGKGDIESKLKKSKALAQKALRRLRDSVSTER